MWRRCLLLAAVSLATLCRVTAAICMAMFKGGVGKSTTAVNVAACLARDGQRTLLVDVDPQANATEMWIPEHEVEFDLRSVIADRVPVAKVIRPTRIDNLSVLPASFDLSYLDKELVVSPNGVLRVGRVLRDVRGDYDRIVLDTGPNLSHLTLGALAAAEHIVIPVSATVWATSGLRKFLRWIDQHREDEVLHARLLGLVATMVDARTRVGRGLRDDLAVSDLPAFRTWIPRRVRAEDAAFERLVAGDPGMDISLATAYRDLTAELQERLAGTVTARHAR
jgi:chromosome partitioning protein